jgi:mono/diheme cytochrome c family protein
MTARCHLLEKVLMRRLSGMALTMLMASAALSACSEGTESAPAKPDSSVERGKALVKANCARCHSTEAGVASTHADAPSFATLFTAYPPEYIEEAFAEGVFVGHGEMPKFEFQPDEIADLVAYLKTLGPTPS